MYTRETDTEDEFARLITILASERISIIDVDVDVVVIINIPKIARHFLGSLIPENKNEVTSYPRKWRHPAEFARC